MTSDGKWSIVRALDPLSVSAFWSFLLVPNSGLDNHAFVLASYLVIQECFVMQVHA